MGLYAAYVVMFSCGVAGAAVMILERRDRVYRQGSSDPGATFLVFAVIFILLSASMSTVGAAHPWFFVAMHPVAALGLAALYAWREWHCRDFEQYRKQQLEEALANWEKALRREPDSADLHIQIARVCAELGYLDRAEKHFEEAARLAPSMEESWDLQQLRETRGLRINIPPPPPKTLKEKILAILNTPLNSPGPKGP